VVSTMAGLDLMGAAGGFFDLGGFLNLLIGVLILFIVAIIAWKAGLVDRLLKKYQTITINFENRQGNLVLTDIDRAQSVSDKDGTVYKLKNRKTTTNAPPLKFIHRTNGGQNVVLMFFPDRDEGYPLDVQMVTAKKLLDEAKEEYYIKVGRAPDTVKELESALLLLDAKEKIRFLPVVDESSINLVMTQLQKVDERYTSRFGKIMQYMPIITTAVLALVMIVGFYLIAGKVDDMDFTVTCASSAVNTAAQAVKDVLPVEMP
jgi:hypothetical protein